MILAPNGWRYLRVGGTRQRHFIGTNFKPRKLLKNAATPTRRVHAVLGALTERKTSSLKPEPPQPDKIYTYCENADKVGLSIKQTY